MLRIAPENQGSLKKFKNEYNPKISFTEDIGFKFRVNTETKEIKLPIVALEYLWCASYTFYLVYQKYQELQAQGCFEFDLYGDNDLKLSMKLYQWGYNRINNEKEPEWGNELPRPDKNAKNKLSNEQVTNELFLASLGWILHHEIAHIYHKHNNKPLNNQESIKQEKKADLSATIWILGNVQDERMIKKRGIGISIALLVIVAQDILLGKFEETTHPKSFERLFDNLDKNFENENDIVYAFSMVILHAHMAQAKIKIEINHESTWKDNFSNCLVKLSRI